MRRLNRRFIFVTVICFILLIVLVVYSLFFHTKKSVEISNMKLLNQYGWNNAKLTMTSNDEFKLDLANNELDAEKVSASEKIGLSPLIYLKKPVTIYEYNLGVVGYKETLTAWVYCSGNDIICAYILHSENKIKLRYWPIDTPYQEIATELKNSAGKLNK